ncbi:hypothetical protein [Flammeovirga sp. EKP202]|uniref:hypothetical protein n=1 Tax=Flammeovirga sp. EKP202 TaxID=2770592 RepID=UPI00165F2A75|nr:hypothetical protein [Flammeovirga sp. EKP202]MBD0402924.1 hypothetical protein [Flammeovirga sp. EKP202]
MGKITVKHYLNKKLKSRLLNNVEHYPLYIQVVYNRKSLRFKSSIAYNDGFLNDNDLNMEPLKSFIKIERDNIEKVVKVLSDNDVDIVDASKINLLSQNLFTILNNTFGAYYTELYYEKYEEVDVPMMISTGDFHDIYELDSFLYGAIQDKLDDNIHLMFRMMVDIMVMKEEIMVCDYLYGNGKVKLKEFVQSIYDDKDLEIIHKEIDRMLSL